MRWIKTTVYINKNLYHVSKNHTSLKHMLSKWSYHLPTWNFWGLNNLVGLEVKVCYFSCNCSGFLCVVHDLIFFLSTHQVFWAITRDKRRAPWTGRLHFIRQRSSSAGVPVSFSWKFFTLWSLRSLSPDHMSWVIPICQNNHWSVQIWKTSVMKMVVQFARMDVWGVYKISK